jgi:hypothetical protein
MKALDPSANVNAANVNPEQKNMGMQPPPGMPPGGFQPADNVTGRRPPQFSANASMQRPGMSGNFTFPGMPGGMMPPPPDGMQPPPEGMPSPPQGMGGPGFPGGIRGNLLQQMELKTNENKADYSALFRFLEVLNNESSETFRNEIEKVLEVDQVLKFIAVSAVLVHLDNYTGSFGHNYYLYESNGKFSVIPWDFNMAFGTFSSGLDRQGIINFYIDEPTDGAVSARPLVAKLLAVPEYLERYHGYIRQMIDGPFSYTVMNDKIDSLVTLIRPYVEKDNLKFYSTEKFESSLEEDTAGTLAAGGMTPLALKGFIRERIESIRKQLEGTLPARSADGSGNRAAQRSAIPRSNNGGNQ